MLVGPGAVASSAGSSLRGVFCLPWTSVAGRGVTAESVVARNGSPSRGRCSRVVSTCLSAARAAPPESGWHVLPRGGRSRLWVLLAIGL